MPVGAEQMEFPDTEIPFAWRTPLKQRDGKPSGCSKSGGAGGAASCRGFRDGTPKPCSVTHFLRTSAAMFVVERFHIGVFQQSWDGNPCSLFFHSSLKKQRARQPEGLSPSGGRKRRTRGHWFFCVQKKHDPAPYTLAQPLRPAGPQSRPGPCPEGGRYCPVRFMR